jgi:subtilisin family serine protease
MRRHLIHALVLLFLPLVAQALPAQRDGVAARHYILESAVPLDAAASAELAAEGIDVQQPLANHRYLVRMADGISLPHDGRIRSLRAYDASHKIARAAYAEAARGKAFALLRVVFHQDVTFEEAQAAIDAVGGRIDTPFAVASASPQRLTVRIPSAATLALAADERVFGVYGPPLRPRHLNAFAAQISQVTPLYSAPYNLTGNGVVLSIFEPDGAPDATHLEFGGRLISHFDASRTVDAHATHVSGTMVAAGINADAKGMSPAATLHAYDANPVDAEGNPDFAKLLQVKTDGPKSVGSVADNNSWDFGLSWQYAPSCPGSVPFCVWTGNEDAYGAYSALESEPYDAIARMAGAPLFVHAAGNDADSGTPSLLQPWSPHKHYNDKTGDVDSGTFCYSQNKTGTDCPTAAPYRCSTGKSSDGQQYCEVDSLDNKIPHPTHGATTTVGLMGSTKNSMTVGALLTDSVTIASFSSRGPTLDGRVKPEIVANGTNQFSTEPNNTYGIMNGTSMATPVVTGIAGLLTQQYRKTFGKTPTAALLKTLLIAGADDLGNPGPDYTFGFGLADAKASADLIVADNGFGSRIRTGTVSNGQDIDIPITLAASQKLRVVLGWFDPEVLLVPDPSVEGDDPLADKTLINDLDLRVVDPAGNAVLPYALNGATPSATATRGVNHTDTTEEVEIANAVPGTYHVIVHGAIGDTRSSSQDYVLVMNGGSLVAACTDVYEPNDTPATAWGNVLNGQTVAPKICSAGDVDYFTFVSNSTAPIVVNVAAGDTPLKVTLSSSASTTVTQTIAANSSAALTTNIVAGASPTSNVAFFIRVEPNGAVGASGSYTVTPFYTFVTVPRRRATKH